jgi:hypothetical protein
VHIAEQHIELDPSDPHSSSLAGAAYALDRPIGRF